MRKNLKAKTLESLSSVLPITAIVLALSFTLAPDMPAGTLMMFLLGAILLIVGMGFFSLGADMAMMPMGDGVGGEVVRLSKRSLLPVLPLVFLIGAFITMAEPDLQVLANQVPAVPDLVIILTVAAGVGGFLVVSVLRTLRGRLPLHTLLLGFYLIVFALAAFVPREFLAVAFDAGGVTTGLSWPSAPAWPPSGRARARRRTTASAWWPCAASGRSWQCSSWACASPARRLPTPPLR